MYVARGLGLGGAFPESLAIQGQSVANAYWSSGISPGEYVTGAGPIYPGGQVSIPPSIVATDAQAAAAWAAWSSPGAPAQGGPGALSPTAEFGVLVWPYVLDTNSYTTDELAGLEVGIVPDSILLPVLGITVAQIPGPLGINLNHAQAVALLNALEGGPVVSVPYSKATALPYSTMVLQVYPGAAAPSAWTAQGGTAAQWSNLTSSQQADWVMGLPAGCQVTTAEGACYDANGNYLGGAATVSPASAYQASQAAAQAAAAYQANVDAANAANAAADAAAVAAQPPASVAAQLAAIAAAAAQPPANVGSVPMIAAASSPAPAAVQAVNPGAVQVSPSAVVPSSISSDISSMPWWVWAGLAAVGLILAFGGSE